MFHRQVIGRDENHMFGVYEISTEEKIIAEKPQIIGDAAYVVLEKFYPEILPENWILRWS